MMSSPCNPPHSLTSRINPDETTNDPEYIRHYRVIRRLSEGGQGTVYHAYDSRLRRDVAIKLGRTAQPQSVASLNRMLEEGAWLARINHPRTPRVYECGLQSGFPYLVLEYIPGMTLAEYSRTGKLSSQRIVRLMNEIASGVAAAHRSGILHLDLKPENVLVTLEGTCRLIDFGLATELAQSTETQLLAVAGTTSYMSPEQRTGGCCRLSARTDVFGLGGILFFLLTGNAPLDSEPLAADAVAIRLEQSFVLLQKQKRSDPFLAAICRRALSVKPDNRFDDVEEFQRHLALWGRRPTFFRSACIAGLLLATGFTAEWTLSNRTLLAPSPLEMITSSHKEQRRVVRLAITAQSSHSVRIVLEPPGKPAVVLDWTLAEGASPQRLQSSERSSELHQRHHPVRKRIPSLQQAELPADFRQLRGIPAFSPGEDLLPRQSVDLRDFSSTPSDGAPQINHAPPNAAVMLQTAKRVL
ncbi:serine/threonine-protein kinase [Planctomicrobium sp. SH664]|uniref:serine/threonine-protein kinase n=1 Tax=Planctomicrobium sp. SH664 TaxID=3448125 RepID=UPI003F5BC093